VDLLVHNLVETRFPFGGGRCWPMLAIVSSKNIIARYITFYSYICTEMMCLANE
jgi:hypothetical protein